MPASPTPKSPRAGSLREVGCALGFEVVEPALLAFQIAIATTAGAVLEEQLTCTGPDGSALPIREITDELGGRTHLVTAPRGPLLLGYSASATAADAAGDGRGARYDTPGHDMPGLDEIVALRQSRYCQSDALVGFAATEFPGTVGAPPDVVALAVASWVFERLTYALGSSGPLDTALDTLHSGVGVCRDFAHLTITLCRALGVPARLAAVYAPGLSPMDFHAVVEVRTASGWLALDPSRLAPRPTLVRIATGRDAADTAFATTLRGDVELVTSRVFASSDGDLPADDHVRAVQIG